MKKEFNFKRIFLCLSAIGLSALTTQSIAGAYQLFEQDAAGVGNFHAGRLAEAKDASIAFYNPAGITHIKNKQVVLGGVFISTAGQFRGTVNTNTFLGNATQQATVDGGGDTIVPDLHAIYPINDRLGLGFSVDVPFGLATDYGRTTPLKYAADRSVLQVIDVSPSFGYRITDKISAGAGLDIQRASAQLTSVGTFAGLEATDNNKAKDTAYGFHVGLLYECNCSTRFGLAFHSKVVHHLKGTSKLEGVLANIVAGGPVVSTNLRTTLALPPYTSLGFYHDFNPTWSVMGSVVYTQWTSTQKDALLQNVTGLTTTTGVVVVPQRYTNSWFASIGADYHVNQILMMRGGLAFNQSPIKNNLRSIILPDTDQYIAALGARVQMSRCTRMDLGWAHVFTKTIGINNGPQNANGQITSVVGTIRPSADVIGAQLTWDIV